MQPSQNEFQYQEYVQKTSYIRYAVSVVILDYNVVIFQKYIKIVFYKQWLHKYLTVS